MGSEEVASDAAGVVYGLVEHAHPLRVSFALGQFLVAWMCVRPVHMA